MTDTSADTFPRQYARTQRLTLGEPRTITVSPDGQRVVFCRSSNGSDAVNSLWVLDVASGDERLVADPRALLVGNDDANLPAEERARRERAREGAGGVVGYATDTDVTVAAFALAGRLFVAGLISAQAREVVVDGPVFDPRPAPTADRVAYVSGATLRIAELDGTSVELAGPTIDHTDDDERERGHEHEHEHEANVTWGSADFIAAEEMGRGRGYWWSPDGTALAVTRVDTSAVLRWYIADPAQPAHASTEHAYPAAGTANADVTLHVINLDGRRVEVTWDRERFCYLVNVAWTRSGLLLVVQTRDQTELRVLRADPQTGETTTTFSDRDDQWVEIVPGTPSVLDDGRLLMCADWGGTRRLLVDGVPVTGTDWQVRSVLGVSGRRVLLAANRPDDATVQHLLSWDDASGTEQLTEHAGMHSAVVGSSTIVVRTSTLDNDGAHVSVLGGPTLANNAETPLVRPNVTLHHLGERALATAVLLPSGVAPGMKLPVLVDPYGGPHAQRVVASRNAYLTSQWFADQGFAVVIIDGRGTPGRGSEWERAVHRDLAGPVLDDQVDALLAAAAEHPELDLGRVAIRGWSFGGYLAALAVLRRPEVFHAAIAGAPVTEWRLYDTHYTERYLGDPAVDAGPYDRCSLLTEADALRRPLLLIHGLADDNVVAAHTLQFSSALLAAGRPHQVLPLSGVTHMTPQEIVAENLLLLQLEFLRTSLALDR